MRTFIWERGRSGGRLDRSDQRHARSLLGVGMHGGCSARNSARGVSARGVQPSVRNGEAAHRAHRLRRFRERRAGSGLGIGGDVVGVQGGDVQRSGDGGRAGGSLGAGRSLGTGGSPALGDGASLIGAAGSGEGTVRARGRGVDDWGRRRWLKEQRAGRAGGWRLAGARGRGIGDWGRRRRLKARTLAQGWDGCMDRGGTRRVGMGVWTGAVLQVDGGGVFCKTVTRTCEMLSM